MTDDRWLERVAAALRDADQPVADLAPRILERVRAEPARLADHRRFYWIVGGLAAAAMLFALVRPGDRVTMGPAAVVVERPIAFEIDASAASRVSVVGDFNNWDRVGTPMTKDPAGQWRATVSLPTGIYRYAFLVDDARWVPDPRQATPVDRDFGEPTSLVTVQ